MSDIMTNAPRLRQVPPANGLEPYTIEQLATERECAGVRALEAKNDIAAIDAEYTRRFKEEVDTQMTVNESRSATLDLPGGFKVKGSVSKTVKWDGDRLKAIAATMSWEQASHFFKIAFTMAEATFKALDPTSELAKTAKSARTVKFGDLKVTVEAPKSC